MALHQSGLWAHQPLELQHGETQALSVLLSLVPPTAGAQQCQSQCQGWLWKGLDAGHGQTPLSWLQLQLLQGHSQGHLNARKAMTTQQDRALWGRFLQDRDILGGCQSVGSQFGCSQ